MREDILKSYEYQKQEIDRWFVNCSRDRIAENKRNDAIECIFCIGKAYMFSLILSDIVPFTLIEDFGIDVQKEREYMRKIKDYLQFDVLENLCGGVS